VSQFGASRTERPSQRPTRWIGTRCHFLEGDVGIGDWWSHPHTQAQLTILAVPIARVNDPVGIDVFPGRNSVRAIFQISDVERPSDRVADWDLLGFVDIDIGVVQQVSWIAAGWVPITRTSRRNERLIPLRLEPLIRTV
jgi:hypothetical protein